MRAGFDKRWLVPLGILTASALIALSITAFEPSFVGLASADCSGASASDYACHQERYQDLTRDSGVEAAFAELKGDYEKNDLVRSNCHQLTHGIGYTAAELYGDLHTMFIRGDPFCGAGYHHGATQSVVARIGADEIPEKANMVCADLGEHQKYSVYHYNCAHGLGHGFMGVYENELFEALRACDALADLWEREYCYGGVFMENIEAAMMAEEHPSHPSKYLKDDQPPYPCTEVQTRYKHSCYMQQTMYALYTQDDDFAKVFDLCGEVEEDFRPGCYQGLGGNVAGRSIGYGISDAAAINSINKLCTMDEDDEVRSNCVIGAARYFIFHYDSNDQAKKLCESFDDSDLRASCLQTAEGFFDKLDKVLEPHLDL